MLEMLQINDLLIIKFESKFYQFIYGEESYNT